MPSHYTTTEGQARKGITKKGNKLVSLMRFPKVKRKPELQ